MNIKKIKNFQEVLLENIKKDLVGHSAKIYTQYNTYTCNSISDVRFSDEKRESTETFIAIDADVIEYSIDEESTIRVHSMNFRIDQTWYEIIS